MEHFEIERKFLIAMPDEKALAALAQERGGEVWNIVQAYLRTEDGVSSRVRRVESGKKVAYYRTDKRKLTDLRRIEDEREIGGDEYIAAFMNADPDLKPITKTRYRIPDGKLTWEVDVFPFWKRQAFLEVELTSEDEAFVLPDFAKVIREVTADRAYTNRALAREIPEEE